MSISVVIPTYNRHDLVLRALDSVYRQAHTAAEVIVVDDGSSDGTCLAVKNRFPQTTLLSTEHRGVSAARNTGINAASGTWIAFLDSDDSWHERKLERQTACIEANPDASIVHCDEQWIRNGVPLSQKVYHEKSGGDIFARSLKRCLISPSAVMIKSTLFDEVGVFDETLTACEDYDLWLRICAVKKVHFVAEKLITKYGGHSDQLSSTIWGLDRFRIKSLHKIVTSGVLEQEQRILAITVLKKKVNIFVNGATKRGRAKEADEYIKLLADVESSTT